MPTTSQAAASIQSAPGEYDNELLDMHFICGDGRCNENIALSAIHQVFHSEHDRLVEDIENTLSLDPDLLAAYQATRRKRTRSSTASVCSRPHVS